MLDSASHALRDLMLDAGVATETQLNEMEEEQSRSGKSLFEVVTDFGMISEIDLMRLIADNLGSEVVDLENIIIPPEVIALMSFPIIFLKWLCAIRLTFSSMTT